MTVAIVANEELDSVWPICLPHLRRAINRAGGRHSEEMILDGVSSRKMQLWVVVMEGKIVSSSITEIRSYPGRKMLAILLCGGLKMKVWINAFVAKLKEVCKRHNIVAIETIGRIGWSRILAPLGFKEEPVRLLEAVVLFE